MEKQEIREQALARHYAAKEQDQIDSVGMIEQTKKQASGLD